MSDETIQPVKSQTIPVYVWIIGVVILLVAGWFGFKLLIAPFQEYRVTLVDAPKEIAAGTTATFTWRVDGPATTIKHTSVHLGSVSNPGELGKEVKPGDTKYTEFVGDFASGNFNIPLQFIGNIPLKNPGIYYYRVHALVGDKNYWGDEYTLEIKSSTTGVTLVNSPKEAFTDEVITFTWRVDGPPATINHTSVHYGLKSNPGVLGKDLKPADTTYKDLVTEFADGSYNIPLQFIGNTQIATAGAYFYRAHAIINGDHFWTDEGTLDVKKKPKTTSVKEVAAPKPTQKPTATPAEEDEEASTTSTP